MRPRRGLLGAINHFMIWHDVITKFIIALVLVGVVVVCFRNTIVGTIIGIACLVVLIGVLIWSFASIIWDFLTDLLL